MPKEEEVDEDCFVSDCPTDRTVYRWTPNMNSNQEMYACEEHFHNLWSGKV